MMILSSAPLDLVRALSIAAVIAACWHGPLGLSGVAVAQQEPRERLDAESPQREAQLDLHLREQLADYRAQAVGAGFMTVVGMILAVASLPALFATVLISEYGAANVAFAVGTGASLTAGLALLISGAVWWRGSADHAAHVSARLGEAAPRSSWGPHGGGGVLLRQVF